MSSCGGRLSTLGALGATVKPARGATIFRPASRTVIRAAARTRNGNPGLMLMIRKLASGEYRLYSRKTDPRTGKRRNLGTFPTREAAEKHEREVQYFKRH